MFFALDQGGAPLRQFRTPLMQPADTTDVAPAPRLGEHTRDVLLECGYSDEELAGLLAAKAITGL